MIQGFTSYWKGVEDNDSIYFMEKSFPKQFSQRVHSAQKMRKDHTKIYKVYWDVEREYSYTERLGQSQHYYFRVFRHTLMSWSTIS